MMSSLQKNKEGIHHGKNRKADYLGREKAFLAGSHSGMEKKWP